MDIDHLKRLHRGKVRDLYEVDDEHMLIVTSDRISAFDVILPTPIPGKGEVLTGISNFWFARMRDQVPNHLSEVPLDSVISDPELRRLLAPRSVIARRLRSLPVEAIVRGYLIGSGWKDYQRNGSLCGIRLPRGLRQADRLPEPLFTPSTKAEVGDHDVNIDFGRAAAIVGAATAGRIRELSLEIYRRAADYALGRGIIIADTKFEFGLDADGEVVLIDEVLTPDSSRFWPAENYRPGTSPPSFDKQFVRDYLDTLDWDRTAPGPDLPTDVIEKTAEKYQEAYARLTGAA
jgi:phosphoribosylaminoimidazole-succinocarboxamide synthase